LLKKTTKSFIGGGNRRKPLTCHKSLMVVFSGYSVSSTNKIDCNDITVILLKVALNTIRIFFLQRR
jgi:hypothetical protein